MMLKKYLKYKYKYKNLKGGECNDDKWLVLDVDECLYPPTYEHNNIIQKYIDSFIICNRHYISNFVNDIKKIILYETIDNSISDLDRVVNYLKKVNKDLMPIIGLFMLLKKYNIYYDINEYYDLISKNFPYNKINKNININNAIANAKKNGMKCAIFSNGSKPHVKKCLKYLELSEDLFEYISSVDFDHDCVLNLQKPHDIAYLHFQQQIKAKPKNIYFFDDSEKNCIAGQKRKWNVVLVKPLNPNPKIFIDVLSTDHPIELSCFNNMYCIQSINDINKFIY